MKPNKTIANICLIITNFRVLNLWVSWGSFKVSTAVFLLLHTRSVVVRVTTFWGSSSNKAAARHPLTWRQYTCCSFCFCAPCSVSWADCLELSWFVATSCSTTTLMSVFFCYQYTIVMGPVQRWILTQRQWRARVSNWAASPARGGVRWRVLPPSSGTSGGKERPTSSMWVQVIAERLSLSDASTKYNWHSTL